MGKLPRNVQLSMDRLNYQRVAWRIYLFQINFWEWTHFRVCTLWIHSFHPTTNMFPKLSGPGLLWSDKCCPSTVSTHNSYMHQWHSMTGRCRDSGPVGWKGDSFLSTKLTKHLWRTTGRLDDFCSHHFSNGIIKCTMALPLLWDKTMPGYIANTYHCCSIKVYFTIYYSVTLCYI